METLTQDRIKGVAQGLAVGDLMGSPFEGMDLSAPYQENAMIMSALSDETMDPAWREWAHASAALTSHVQQTGKPVREYLGALNTTYLELGETTDDTAMALATIRSVIASGGIDRHSLRDHYVEWYRGGAAKGVGGSTCLMLAEQDPKETNEILDPLDSSRIVRMRGPTLYLGWGQREWNEERGRPNHKWPFNSFPANGAAMRIPVVALALLKEEVTQSDINTASDTVTQLTHPYPQCLQTSRALVTLTRDLIRSGDPERAVAGVFDRYPNIIDAAYDALTKEQPHTGGNLESFAIALDAILLSDNYESAVTRAINATSIYGRWASDSDTYGAIAGALAGAAYGASSIPEKWARPLDPEANPIIIKPVTLHEIGGLALQTVTAVNAE
ncbi:ADP-ribosylglycohydrolase family protein [Candidatus Saccharibacteria bacterium]|nr:ADP-ribosylglycohydrolase family protein [Candidatus Saccharibacteria bacterium]